MVCYNDNTMATCARCKQMLAVSEFHLGPRKRDSYCRPCRRSYEREHYAKNREKYKKKRLKNSRKQRERNRSFVNSQKRGKPCLDCGGVFHFSCMEYDHVSGDKVKCINSMVQSAFSIKMIKAEMDKCELVCANCHRVRTWNRSNG